MTTGPDWRPTPPAAIAICKRCGREYLWLPPGITVDGWPAQGTNETEPCGGELVPITLPDTPEAPQ